MRRLVLTTGDVDGIGTEITARALREIRLKKQQSICVVLHPRQLSIFRKKFGPRFKLLTSEAEALNGSHAGVLVYPRTDAPAYWVEWAARACMKKSFDALVTGPLSKPGIRKAGLKDLGHTEILGRISGRKTLFMSFWGAKFNVVLVTGHLPIAQVPKAFTAKRLSLAAMLTADFVRRWNGKIARCDLAWVGLNPHAGDQKLIGKEEATLNPKLRSLRLKGPLVPDSAFLPSNWPQYSAYLCAYHDQGLIPFKLAHGFDEGVHVTLGLPFLRTSVDHGPAKELVGTGLARHGSMKDAIQMALDFKSLAR